MNIQDCNPFIRAAEIQLSVLEGKSFRKAYDHRLFYVLEGDGLLLLKNSEYQIGINSVMYLPPNTEYYFKGKLKVIVLNFDVTRSFAYRTEPICPSPIVEFDDSLLFDQTVLDIEITPMINNSGIKEDLLDIVHAFNKDDELANACISTLLKKVIIELIKDSTSENSSDKLIESIRRYVKLHCCEIESNEDVAKKFGYHPVYLASLFKERTGITLHKLILKERVNLACMWLEKTELSIDEIAFNAGFSTRNHFCTVFKKLMSVSPLVYRKYNK